MPGQAAGLTRAEVASKLKSLNLSPQRKNPTGEDPVSHPNFYGNPPMKFSNGAITGKTRTIKIKGPKL